MNHTINNRFTISLTKSQLDTIQKQFLKEMDEMLDKIRNNDNNNNESSSFSSNLSQFDQISQYSSKIFKKITTKLTEERLFYEIEQVFPHRIDMTTFTTDLKEKEELESYLDSHLDELKILDATNNNNKITTRQFILN